MTAAGRAALEAELAELVDKRADVVRRIADTRSQGDLRENAAYHQAREDQSRIEGRVLEVEEMLRTAVVVSEGTSDGTVQIGATVLIADDLGETRYTLVGAHEADPAAGRLSHQSPVGRALLGRTPGDTVVVQTPAGGREIRILEVR
ncbi:MAG TPA: transcription elongation factor GreA [Candidatus Dormibacteraeota bacterium]|nr:transcription elongation factor GreA [Candidatus Dormibacteraeota bacterium]